MIIHYPLKVTRGLMNGVVKSHLHVFKLVQEMVAKSMDSDGDDANTFGRACLVGSRKGIAVVPYRLWKVKACIELR